MSKLNELGQGLEKAWHLVADGWRYLVDRAGDAVTRFQPVNEEEDAEPTAALAAEHGARWGVLAADVGVTDDEVLVELEVPGMDATDFTVHVVGGNLVVRGRKSIDRERTIGNVHVMERAYGAFERAVGLPVPVDENGGQAKYSRGILQVTLPRTDQALPGKQIEVTAD